MVNSSWQYGVRVGVRTGRILLLSWLLSYKITMVYLTIIPRAYIGYEMIDSQRGA